MSREGRSDELLKSKDKRCELTSFLPTLPSFREEDVAVLVVAWDAR